MMPDLQLPYGIMQQKGRKDMLIKILVVFLLIAAIFSLGSALVHLIRDRGQTDRVVKALTWRIIFSFVVFFIIIGAYFLGLLHPNVL